MGYSIAVKTDITLCKQVTLQYDKYYMHNERSGKCYCNHNLVITFLKCHHYSNSIEYKHDIILL